MRCCDEEELMSIKTRVSHPIYNLLPTDIEAFDSFTELALDIRWSWNHATDEVWRQLDPDLVGDHPQPLGGLAGGLEGKNRECFGQPRLSQEG
jgi:hypothetical protein